MEKEARDDETFNLKLLVLFLFGSEQLTRRPRLAV